MSSPLASVVFLLWRLKVLKKALAAAQDPLDMSGGDTMIVEEKVRLVRRKLKKARRILFRLNAAKQYYGGDSFLYNTFAGLLEEEPLRIQEAEAAQRATERRRQERLQRHLEAEERRVREEVARLLQWEQDGELRALFRQCTAIPEDWKCAICLDDNHVSVVSTQCKHHFHQRCILDWVNRTQTCPLCRGSLVERSEVENG